MSDTSKVVLNLEQPPPIKNAHPAIWDLVRDELVKKYNVTCRHCREKFAGHSASRFCSDLCMFMANASPTDPTACWHWRGKHGEYSKVERKKGECQGAHSFAYELFWGPIEEGNIVRHICNEPSCVNPFHLVQGTYQQNSQDMIEARRQAYGMRHGQAKLTDDAVREIRQDEEATDIELAERYGVSRRSIRKARIGETWKLLDADMHERDRIGQQRYGLRLQPHNGRDALADAYAEALDLCVYLRQVIFERDGR